MTRTAGARHQHSRGDQLALAGLLHMDVPPRPHEHLGLVSFPDPTGQQPSAQARKEVGTASHPAGQPSTGRPGAQTGLLNWAAPRPLELLQANGQDRMTRPGGPWTPDANPGVWGGAGGPQAMQTRGRLWGGGAARVEAEGGRPLRQEPAAVTLQVCREAASSPPGPWWCYFTQVTKERAQTG